MIEDCEYHEFARHLHSAGERLLLAGWAGGVGRGANGFRVAFTDQGLEKIRLLWRLLAELGVESMTTEEANALRALVLLTAERQDWPSDDPGWTPESMAILGRR